MNKLAFTALACTTALLLTACGSSDKASEEASAENVEMPAEEAMSGVDASATPVADTAAATDSATGAAVSSSASEAAAPVSPATDAAEKATAEAEKKM